MPGIIYSYTYSSKANSLLIVLPNLLIASPMSLAPAAERGGELDTPRGGDVSLD